MHSAILSFTLNSPHILSLSAILSKPTISPPPQPRSLLLQRCSKTCLVFFSIRNCVAVNMNHPGEAVKGMH